MTYLLPGILGSVLILRCRMNTTNLFKCERLFTQLEEVRFTHSLFLTLKRTILNYGERIIFNDTVAESQMSSSLLSRFHCEHAVWI